MTKALFQITPLDCVAGTKKIEDCLYDQLGMVSVKVFPQIGKVRTVFDETKVNIEQLEEIMTNLGYPVQSKKLK